MDLEMGMDSMYAFVRLLWPASKSVALYGFDFGFSIKKEEFLMVLKHQSFPERWDKKKNIKQKLGDWACSQKKPRSEMVLFQWNQV